MALLHADVNRLAMMSGGERGVELMPDSCSGEKLWRMPIEDSYLEHIQSPIADLKNVGIQHRYGGAITAALFLKEFVRTDTVSTQLVSAVTNMT